MVPLTDHSASRRVHKHHAHPPANEWWQRVNGQADVIDHAQLIFGCDEHFCPQFHDEFARAETFAERTKQPTSAFYQNRIEAMCDFPNMSQDFPQLDALPSMARSQQRRHRQIKVPRVDLIERQHISRGASQPSRIGPFARGNGLQRSDMDASLMQMTGKQPRQDSFPDASIRACDDDDAAHGVMKSGMELCGENGVTMSHYDIAIEGGKGTG